MRLAIVLPRGARFDRERPTSIETVVRTLAGRSRWADRLTVVCEGDRPHSRPGSVVVPAGLGRRAWLEAVADQLRRLGPDLVEHHQQLALSAALSRRLPEAAHLFYRHTALKRPADPLSAWRYERRLAAFDRLVFVSGWARDRFIGDYPAFRGRARALPNPIEFERWRADPDRREPLILFSGRATPEKGLDLFCPALAATLERRPGWRGALMLGEWRPGPNWAATHLRALERFADRVRVEAWAPLDVVREATRRAAIAVVPSRVEEALGLTALEAHAAGAALISTGRGGLAEASGGHALLVEPDPEAIARAMSRLIDRPGERRRLARAAQAHVGHAFDPARRAAELDELRTEVVRDGAGRGRRHAAPRLRSPAGAPG